ncbi:MAG TPA: ABC transporter permease [Roseimicrobium sp.]|nr:ABC transporter permease [Roseimicrobium sp.]
MESAIPTASPESVRRPHIAARVVRVYLEFVGRQILRVTETIHGLGAFALITAGVVVTKFNHASRLIHPQVRNQIHLAGVRLLPMVFFIGLALGLVVIGQMVALLTRFGVQNLVGTVMVTVVVRELGPIIAALTVLIRVGTPTVIELGTARAQGEVEALEALGIDPIHYLVVPRVIGLGLSIFGLTVYLILVSLASGYLVAFLQDVPLLPLEYLKQISVALMWQDFVLLAFKTTLFGALIATVTCFQGLALPLRLEEVSQAATRAVTHSVVGCVILDVVFIITYLLL